MTDRKLAFKKITVLLICILCANTTLGNEYSCLAFSEGIALNNGKEFIKANPFLHIDASTKLYSTKFDLNKDGNPEYFYFIEDIAFCGQQTGSVINAYEFKDGKFRDLFKYGILTSGEFNPKSKSHSNDVCVLEDKSSGWHNILILGSKVAKYNGKEYIFMKSN